MSARLGLFAYDMTAIAPRQQVLRQLRRWRVNGQLSVHACHLREFDAPPLFHQLTTAITPRTDQLLFTCWSPPLTSAQLAPLAPLLSAQLGCEVSLELIPYARNSTK